MSENYSFTTFYDIIFAVWMTLVTLGNVDKKILKALNDDGPFGPVFSQFIGRPQAAINYLLSIRKGEALGALFHRDIGDISLVYGNDDYGLKKIAAKHPGILSNLQESINEMSVIIDKSGQNRIRL